jgi:hypothetical protein
LAEQSSQCKRNEGRGAHRVVPVAAVEARGLVAAAGWEGPARSRWCAGAGRLHARSAKTMAQPPPQSGHKSLVRALLRSSPRVVVAWGERHRVGGVGGSGTGVGGGANDNCLNHTTRLGSSSPPQLKRVGPPSPMVCRRTVLAGVDGAVVPAVAGQRQARRLAAGAGRGGVTVLEALRGWTEKGWTDDVSCAI